MAFTLSSCFFRSPPVLSDFCLSSLFSFCNLLVCFFMSSSVASCPLICCVRYLSRSACVLNSEARPFLECRSRSRASCFDNSLREEPSLYLACFKSCFFLSICFCSVALLALTSFNSFSMEVLAVSSLSACELKSLSCNCSFARFFSSCFLSSATRFNSWTASRLSLSKIVNSFSASFFSLTAAFDCSSNATRLLCDSFLSASSSSRLTRAALRSLSYMAYSMLRRFLSSSLYFANSSFSPSNSFNRLFNSSTACSILCFLASESSISRTLSALRSSYTLVPATSLMRAIRSWSCITVKCWILPCCTM
mmetsp:Transcript_110587/g.191687  ORF Transcript_110587/g.191687 Transcript_110587/m.191687 type:complete len:308 (-) Transcript_110587:464-1387(-)